MVESIPAKVVGTIAPPAPAEPAARAGYEEIWRELVATKAHVADMRNQLLARERADDELREYVRRHIKRIDAIASRLARAGQR